MTSSHDDHAASGRSGLAREGDRRATAAVRLAIGLIQGVALWWLTRSWPNEYRHPPVWPATDPWLFGCLFIVFAFLPVVLLAGVGRLRPVTLIVWGGIAGAVMAALAFHDIDRQGLKLDDTVLSPVFLAFTAVALFITHHLIVPADRERRLVAPYPAYFDAAWMAGVQLALSIGFAGAFWLLLFLGAALFKVIGLDFLGDLIRESWFAFPMTGLAFATAVQLTDVRDGLIRGVRAVALMLLSWLLLVMTVLAAGFLAALPFTGLQGLWNTGSATALVLAAAAALIILINTAYQDGRPDNRPPLALRIAVQVASILLTPLIVLAVWGLMLRVGQYGLTPDRIIAAACALVGAVYAVGYGLAAIVPLIRKGSGWMKALEATNLASGVLAVAVILALFSPLADPARLAVADQVKRLEAGKVSPDEFDYRFLAYRSGKAGETALETLIRSQNAVIAKLAAQAKASASSRFQTAPEAKDLQLDITMTEPGEALPAGFSAGVFGAEGLRNCTHAQGGCKARLLDLNKDGRDELLIAHRFSVLVFAPADKGAWTYQGYYMPQTCTDATALDLRSALANGRFATQPPPLPDLNSSATGRWAFVSERGCSTGQGVSVTTVEVIPPTR
ncbi:MAG: DUF4153 domain-containing protein [Caulobacteraceae bacterium]|nr:DUF4153 domain-containing protein [Caulobacteraceae bacterium]